MAAGDQACRQGQWLALAELSGFSEESGFLPRHRAFCCPDIQLAWAAPATPSAHHSLSALGTRRLSQSLDSGRSPILGTCPFCIPHTLLEMSGMSLSPLAHGEPLNVVPST